MRPVLATSFCESTLLHQHHWALQRMSRHLRSSLAFARCTRIQPQLLRSETVTLRREKRQPDRPNRGSYPYSDPDHANFNTDRDEDTSQPRTGSSPPESRAVGPSNNMNAVALQKTHGYFDGSTRSCNVPASSCHFVSACRPHA